MALAGLGLLYVGGEALVRGASALALRLGVSPLAVGLTVVAFGTSAPELVVSLDAVLSGANDIAVGNVVGSNIANIALILGIATVLRPARVEAKLVRLDVPLMIGTSVLLIAVIANGVVSRAEGGLLMAGLAAYVGFTFWGSRRETAAIQDEFVTAARGGAPTGRATLLVAAGMTGLVAGGHLLVTAAVAMASALGISQATIGLSIVAVGTSLPELATSVVASLKGHGDIAIGNIVGSNIFNVLAIVGTTAAVRPLARGGITNVDLGVMLALAVSLLPLLLTRLRLSRVEGGLLVVSWAGYVTWLVVR